MSVNAAVKHFTCSMATPGGFQRRGSGGAGAKCSHEYNMSLGVPRAKDGYRLFALSPQNRAVFAKTVETFGVQTVCACGAFLSFCWALPTLTPQSSAVLISSTFRHLKKRGSRLRDYCKDSLRQAVEL